MSKHRTRKTRWNRLLSGVLCLALVLGLLPASGLIQPAEAHWADPYGEQLVEWGVMNPGTNLRLDSTITRAEFVAMCNRAFGYDKLGSIPFVDVPSTAWYAQDINIAYNAGYFMGAGGNMALPNGTLTREQATVLVARNLMLQETVGEVQGFTDNHSLSDWSRGLIGSAVAEGMITGLPDGTFSPANNISRGEVAAMLVRVIGTPISKPGRYELGGVYGNVMISSSNVELRNTTIAGNLYITGGVDLGNILLENVTVLGRIVVSGGGESHSAQSSVVLRNVTADELVVDSIIDQFVTLSAYGVTDIPVTYVRSDTYLEDACGGGYGLHYIELDGDAGTLLQLAGNIKEVVNKTPFSELQLVQGTAQKITIDEYAKGSHVLVDINTRVEELNLDVATQVSGRGDIGNLNIGAAGCEVDILPDKVTVRPGITATVDGEVIGSTEAAELSAEPRFLADYPKVGNLTPTQVEGLYSVNKPGTIYWAVSELANGSVDVEDLITNPAYGGNIFNKQSGDITASARTEYGRTITGLEPDGSYYLSAIMEDGRGNRSPLKVISFTTPDDTKPEFLNGRISRATCEVVQLTGMANKSCTLYWVLLPAGATAPTPQTFKSGSFGGNYGHGSQNVVKNVPVTIQVNSTRLQEDTDYVLYVWLNDFDGAQSSQVYKFDVHTPDETPPVVINVTQTGFGETDAEVTFSINEAPSTLYWGVVRESKADTLIPPDADLNSQAIQIKVANGKKAGFDVSGSTPANGANLDTIISNITGLPTDTHSFRFYYVAVDAAGNYSRVGFIPLYTLDTDPPHAWLEFSNSVNGTPRSNSDIRIVFDEQVKGGANAARTFLDFYKDVESATSDALKRAAKSALAKELAAHIQLWYVPKDGSASQQKVNTSSDVSLGGGASDWKINWCEAIITMEQGKMVITLPGETRIEDGVEKALNLDSGASYQFRFVGVFDNAFTPNGVAVDENDASQYPICVREGGKESESGNGRLDFTTAFAQVELRDNSAVTKIDGGDALNGIRLDMVLDVDPKSTNSVPDTEFWDMVIWTNTSVTFEIYRQILDNNEKEVAGGGWTKVATVSMAPGNNTEAVSWNHRKDTTVVTDYETVKAGLNQDYIYRYGIHFTMVNGIPETRGHEDADVANASKLEPVAWNREVILNFSVVAGTQGVLMRQFTGDIKTLYGTLVSSGDLTEIGDVNGAGEKSILECKRRFVDTAPPSFTADTPVLTPGSGSVTIEVSLDRPGTVYYVIAPASGTGSINTNVDANTPVINANGEAGCNDGSDKNKPTGKTYIPTGGGDIDKDWHEDKIHFVTGGPNGTPGKYSSPISDSIIDGTYAGRTGVITGSKKVDGTVEKIFESGLTAETWYYVYMVLEGGGDPSPIVQIYRVKTEKIKPPAVVVSPAGGASADMNVFDLTASGGLSTTHYDNSLLFYALWEWGKLPPIFKEYYDWGETALDPNTGRVKETPIEPDANEDGDTVMSVFAAMMTRPSGSGRSYFDKYATETMKTQVEGYIRGIGVTDNVNYMPTSRYYGQDGLAANTKGENFSAIMDDGAEYVVVACARSSLGEETPESYGFGAIRNLYKPDDVPPAFVNTSDNKRYFEATVTDVVDSKGKSVMDNWDSDWREHPERYGYNGFINISFTKELYIRLGTTSYEIVYGNDATDGCGLADLLGGSAITTKRAWVTGGTSGDPVGSGFTIKFSNLRSGDTIEIFTKGRICNESNYASDMKLTLTFTPTLTIGDYDSKSKTPTISAPGFRVSESKVTNNG